jgi:Saxitoxin biosynthesis operon protein SxtJ
VATHESIVEYAAHKSSSDRAFGLTVGGILMALGAVKVVFGSHGLDGWAIGMLIVGGALVLGGYVRPGLLAPLNRAWTWLGLMMYRVINPIVLMLIFIVGVLPTGLVMRAFGHDPLRAKLDRKAASYWIERESVNAGPEHLRNQF